MKNPIAVFDSGMGGLSVLNKLRQTLPHEDFVYYADDLNAPYGTKAEQEIERLVFAAVQKMLTYSPKAIVLACNTATGVCIEKLRKAFPNELFFGVQPAIRPATKPAVVFTTTATANCGNFAKVVRDCTGEVQVFPLPKAAELIEKGADDKTLQQYLAEETASLDLSRFSSAVLGCTHYVLRKECFAKVFRLPLFDGNDGLAARVEQVLKSKWLTGGDGELLLTLSDLSSNAFARYMRCVKPLQG